MGCICCKSCVSKSTVRPIEVSKDFHNKAVSTWNTTTDVSNTNASSRIAEHITLQHSAQAPDKSSMRTEEMSTSVQLSDPPIASGAKASQSSEPVRFHSPPTAPPAVDVAPTAIPAAAASATIIPLSTTGSSRAPLATPSAVLLDARTPAAGDTGTAAAPPPLRIRQEARSRAPAGGRRCGA